jgi:hypothetical protein
VEDAKLKDYERIEVRNFHEWNKRKVCVVLCWLREREREPKGGLFVFGLLIANTSSIFTYLLLFLNQNVGHT